MSAQPAIPGTPPTLTPSYRIPPGPTLTIPTPPSPTLSIPTVSIPTPPSYSLSLTLSIPTSSIPTSSIPTSSIPILATPTHSSPIITPKTENRQQQQETGRRKTVSELAAEFRPQIPPAPRSPPFRPGRTRRQREDDYRMQFREDVGAGYGGWYVPGIDLWPRVSGIPGGYQDQWQLDQEQLDLEQQDHHQDQWQLDQEQQDDNQDQWQLNQEQQDQWRQDISEEQEQHQDHCSPRRRHHLESEVDVVEFDEEWTMLDDAGQSSVGLLLGGSGEDDHYTGKGNDNETSGGDNDIDEAQRCEDQDRRQHRWNRGESAEEEDSIGSENEWEIITPPPSRTNTTHTGPSTSASKYARPSRPWQRRTGLNDCSAEILGRITSYVDRKDLWNLFFVNKATLQEAGRAIYSSDRVQNIPLRQLLEGIQTVRPDFQHPFGRNLKLSFLSHVKVIQHTLGQRNQYSRSLVDEDEDDVIIDMLDNLPSSLVLFPRLVSMVLKGNNFVLSLRLISRSKPKTFCWSSDFSTDLAGTNDLPFSELRFPDGHIPNSVCTHNVDSGTYPIPCYGTLNRVEIRPRSDLQGENAQGRASFVAGIVRLAHPELEVGLEMDGNEQEIQMRKRGQTRWEFAHLCTTTVAFVVQEPGLNPVGLRTEVPRLVRGLIPEMKDRIAITRDGRDGECAACGKRVEAI